MHETTSGCVLSLAHHFFLWKTLFNFNYTPAGVDKGVTLIEESSFDSFLPSGKAISRPPPWELGKICWPRGRDEDQASPLVSRPSKLSTTNSTVNNHQTLLHSDIFVDFFFFLNPLQQLHINVTATPNKYG